MIARGADAVTARATARAHLKALARALDREVQETSLDALVEYEALVRSWSAKVNLVSLRSPEQVPEILFADAFVLADRSLVPDESRLVDVGTGAGAPAVPLLLLRPDLSATCVEPRNKRVAFLRHAAGQLGLDARLTVIDVRVATKAPAVEGAPFDVALSRATLAPAEWLRVGSALARRVLVLTAREPAPAPGEGLRVALTVDYALPSDGARRRITAYDSESPGERS